MIETLSVFQWSILANLSRHKDSATDGLDTCLGDGHHDLERDIRKGKQMDA